MMRKIISVIITVTALLLLASCSRDPEEDNGRTPGERLPVHDSAAQNDTDGIPGEKNSITRQTPVRTGPLPALIGWMLEGQYYFEYTGETETGGQVTVTSGSYAAEGDKLAVSIIADYNGEEQKNRIITLDSIVYMIDDTAKTITENPVELSESDETTTVFSLIEYLGSGEGMPGGETLYYEEYGYGVVTVKYYIQNSEVYAIEIESPGLMSLMYVENASGSVPAGMFDIPVDYIKTP